MNTKKLLAMLFSGLGVFALGLTSCDDTETSSDPTDNPSSDTSTTDPSPDSSTTGPVDDSSTSGDDTPVEDPTLKTYNVNFNYDDVATGMSVYTDYEIDASIAPLSANISGKAEDRRTVPLETNTLTDTSSGSGYYYIAVDADGYIVYASYSLGCGGGAPHDSYYHNQDAQDANLSDYFKSHPDRQGWSNTITYPDYDYDGDGTNDMNSYNLYDFVIPTGGFVVKGHYNDTSDEGFVTLWNHVFTSVPAAAAPIGQGGWGFNATAAKTFDKWYLSINSDHELEVRERKEGEIKVDGEQEIDTPSQNFTPDADDAVKTYNTFEGFADLAKDAPVENVKAVVTYKAGKYVYVQDAQGTNMLVYSPAGEFNVGDTVVINGKKGEHGGNPQVGEATLEVLPGYGRLEAVDPIVVDASNVAETYVEANNFASMKIVKAVVKSIATGVDKDRTSYITVGETDVAIYDAIFPATVAVGDTVDLNCVMNTYNGTLQVRMAAETDMSRYYNVTVDVDGSEGVEAAVTKGYATGETVTMTVKSPSDAYVFSHWAQVTKDAEGAEVLTEVSKDADLTITVGEADAEYRAIFTFAPWTNLADSYVASISATPLSTEGDSALSVFTGSDFVLRRGDWSATNGVGGGNGWKWRYVLIIDGDGKVAYSAHNAANGYGGSNIANMTNYKYHSDYADFHNNPAIRLLEGYDAETNNSAFELVIPEGGFAITGHGDGVAEIVKVLVGDDTYVLDQATYNKAEAYVDSVRAYLDTDGNVKFFVDEANTDVELNGLINATGSLAAVYNDKSENVTLGDFTVAIDENGVIKFAGRTSDGYGGPGDGFYHDGTYAAVAGQQCGIFNLQEGWEPWKQGSTNHTLYTVNVPTGWKIITGSAEQMTPFMQAIDSAFVPGEPYTANANYFEGVSDGMYNATHTVAVTEKTKVANVDLTITEVASSEGLVWGGASMGSFTYNNGVYEATVSLNAWQKINFTYTNAEGTETLLTYDNTTFAGLITADPTLFGCYGDNRGLLFIEADFAAGDFMRSDVSTEIGSLKISYDPATATLTVSDPAATEEPDPTPDPEPDPDPTPDPVHVNMMVPTTVDVFTSADENVTLKDVTIAVDATGKVIFASYTAPGYGGPGDGFYHDGSYAAVAGQQCGIFNLQEGWEPWKQGSSNHTLYSVKAPEGVTIYTGTAADMLPFVNAIFGAELTEMTNNAYLENTAVDGAYNHVVATLTPMVEVNYEHAADLSVYTSADETVTLEDVTVAVDATGKVIFASYTAPGYGGPGDGFYHDGTYAAVAGQQCGIFNLQEGWEPWKQGSSNHTLYTVKAPEGVTIYTGTAAEMLPIINAIFGSELTEMTDNGYLENTAVDGSQNHKVVTLTAAEPAEPVAIYSYGFEDLTGQNTALTNATALEIFQADMGENASKLVSVTVNKIYNGNGTGGAYPNSSGFLKTGTGSANGQIKLTFAEDVQITKVVVVCHDWYKKSASYPTNSNSVSVNGSATQLAPYNETGAFEELVFEIDASNVVTIDTNKRVFISAIYVY